MLQKQGRPEVFLCFRSPGGCSLIAQPEACTKVRLEVAYVWIMLCRTFVLNRERAVDYLNMLERIYVFDGYAGWDPEVSPAFVGHL